MTTPTPEPLTAEEVDDAVRRLGHVRAALDEEYIDIEDQLQAHSFECLEIQDRLQDIGGHRAAVEDAILTLAAYGRLLRETALVPLRSGAEGVTGGPP